MRSLEKLPKLQDSVCRVEGGSVGGDGGGGEMQRVASGSRKPPASYSVFLSLALNPKKFTQDAPGGRGKARWEMMEEGVIETDGINHVL